MANNRNESERRHFEEGSANFEERGHTNRNERDHDPYRYRYRDRDVERRDGDSESDWHRTHRDRDRFSRGSFATRAPNGQYAAFDRDYDYSSNESSRHQPSFAENWIPDWRTPGLRSLYGVTDNEHGFGLGRGSRIFEQENYVGRGPKGYRRSDERIKEDVCDILERHPAIDASEIEITITEGIVVLQGAVENRAQKRLAEDAIENLVGVKDVRNELSINRSLFEQTGDHAREFATNDPLASKEAVRAKDKPSRH